jgi:FKBP-type peptidyl-prolyl cis-trans isomerase
VEEQKNRPNHAQMGINKKRIIAIACLLIAIIVSICTYLGAASNNNAQSKEKTEDASNVDKYADMQQVDGSQITYGGLVYTIPAGWYMYQDDKCMKYFPDNERKQQVIVYESDHSNDSINNLAGRISAFSDGACKSHSIDHVISNEDTVISGLPSKKIKAEGNFDPKCDLTDLIVGMVDKTTGFSVWRSEDEYDSFSNDFDSILASVSVSADEINLYTKQKDIDAANEKKAAEDKAKKDEEAKEKATKDAEAKAQEQAQEQQKQKVAKDTKKAGTYKVGSSIPAGEYKLTASGKGYYCVYPDTAKSKILGNDNFTTSEYVTLADGEVFEMVNASCVPIEDVGTNPKKKLESSGKYLVGTDCPAGDYALTKASGMDGYYAIYNSSDPEANIVQNNNFPANDICSVSDGQYLVICFCTAELE